MEAIPVDNDDERSKEIKNAIREAEIVMLLPTLSYLINMDQLSNEYDFGEGTIDAYTGVKKSVAECVGAKMIEKKYNTKVYSIISHNNIQQTKMKHII